MASRWAAANARMATGTLTKSAGAEMEKRIQGLRNEGKGILKIGREWAAAGLMDTEFRCFMKPEVGHAETTVHSRVQG